MANALRCFWGLLLVLSLQYLVNSMSNNSRVYIVYLGHTHKLDSLLTSNHHVQLLNSVFTSKEEAKQAMLYSYKHVFSGFAATLDTSQATILANTKGVLSVFESQIMELHTTRSWDFMGLTLDNMSQGTPVQLAHGDDIIVGLIDTGVWPESASFMEEPNMGPIPKSWNGQCVSGERFDAEKACNKKLIGARYYVKGFEAHYGKINTEDDPEYRSPRDIVGHGTHTASTAVGSRSPPNASIFGFAQGTARGGAPRARLAVYKACWSINSAGRCAEEDILAAFDDALNDGVHVISMSIGRPPPLRPFFANSADIGSFHAMQLGVSVVFSAGNDGPDLALVGNVNPWSICVAASDMDRSFPTKILLENVGTSFVGEGVITNPVSGLLAYAVDYFLGAACKHDNWMNVSLTGKILICFSNVGSLESEDAEYAAYKANATALIFVQPLTRPTADITKIPVVRLDIIQGADLRIHSSDRTKVQILPSKTTFKRSPAPVVAQYSSKGPSSISPDFLKPDISAPGINILAAWNPNVRPSSGYIEDDRKVEWGFLSGTSISCPHVSGVVALLKSVHPGWSPAAIRSALMTTAYNTDNTGDGIRVVGTTKSSDPFDIGAGHMNPVRALDPGLVYDMSTSDYVRILCNRGYSDEQIQIMVICKSTTCLKCSDQKPEPDSNINYPSITVLNLDCTTTVKRTVRNVGNTTKASYHVSTVNPNGVSVSVSPMSLEFKSLNEEKTFYVVLKPLKASQGRFDFGSIAWSDGSHYVRSPLVVQVNISSSSTLGV